MHRSPATDGCRDVGRHGFSFVATNAPRGRGLRWAAPVDVGGPRHPCGADRRSHPRFGAIGAWPPTGRSRTPSRWSARISMSPPRMRRAADDPAGLRNSRRRRPLSRRAPCAGTVADVRLRLVIAGNQPRAHSLRCAQWTCRSMRSAIPPNSASRSRIRVLQRGR